MLQNIETKIQASKDKLSLLNERLNIEKVMKKITWNVEVLIEDEIKILHKLHLERSNLIYIMNGAGNTPIFKPKVKN